MKSKNICRLIPNAARERLEVVNFIYETDETVMRTERRLRDHCIILIVQGEGTFHLSEARIPFAPGCLIFGFQGELISMEMKTKAECLYISFHGVRAEELFRRFGINGVCRSFPGFEGI